MFLVNSENESGFPWNSLDTESSEMYYDDSCKSIPQLGTYPLCEADCHCSKDAAMDCTTALSTYIGSTVLNMTFTRVAWDETIASTIEAKNKYRINSSSPGSDITPVDVNQAGQGLKRNLIIYRYFESQSCESMECLKGNGWRKLVLFDSIYINVGTKDVNIGQVAYVTGDMTTFDYSIQHEQYYWFACKFKIPY